MDIIDAFEKRNRSRFSGKQILFYLDQFDDYMSFLHSHMEEYEQGLESHFDVNSYDY